VGTPSWLDWRNARLDLGSAITAVGIATTAANGRAELRSVPATGAHLALAIGSEFLEVPMQLEANASGVVVVVEASAIETDHGAAASQE
jgi:hypothetical protein